MTYLIVSLIIVIILFLLFREVVCWYLKINTKISEQKRTIEILENLINQKNTK